MIMWKAVKTGCGCRGAGDYNLNILKTLRCGCRGAGDYNLNILKTLR